MIVFEAFTTMGSDLNIAIIIGLTNWILMPLFLSLLSIPMIFVLDKTYEKRMTYVLKYTRMLGIITPLSDILTFKE